MERCIVKFISVIKKTAAAFLAAVLCCSAAAGAADVPQWLSEYGAQTYAAAKADFGGRSFSGYCGTYVRCQLKAMGIFDGKYDFHGNGNQWYDGFENIGGTSGGYFVYREQGADCINKLVAKYGNDLRNVVVSFPVQAHYSPEYPGAGHVFLIYALIDGIAYYSESFSFGSHAEGSVIAEDVNELIARYSARHGSPNGCVLFSANDLSGPSDEEIAAQFKAEQDAQQAREVIASLEESSDFLFFAEDFMSFDENI